MVSLIIFYREEVDSLLEGITVIEKSYDNLKKFLDAITGKIFADTTNLIINMKNYDKETAEGIKDVIGTEMDKYKDELDLKEPIIKILSGDMINVKIPKDQEAFREDLQHSLELYIKNRLSSLWNAISHNASTGGIYSV